jgi:hypothetical protein
MGCEEDNSFLAPLRLGLALEPKPHIFSVLGQHNACPAVLELFFPFVPKKALQMQ